MTATNDNVQTLLTVKEICARWNCARRTVIDNINAGRMRVVRLGLRTQRVHIDEVLRVEREGINARLSG